VQQGKGGVGNERGVDWVFTLVWKSMGKRKVVGI